MILYNLYSQTSDTAFVQEKLFFNISTRCLFIGIPPFVLKGEGEYRFNKKFCYNIGCYYAVMDLYGKIFNKTKISEQYLVEYNAPYYPFIKVPNVSPNNKWWFHPPFEMFSFYTSCKYKMFKNIYGVIGIGYVIGKMAGKLVYVVNNYGYMDFQMWHAYYEPVFFQDISIDFSLQIYTSKRFFISLYYNYIPIFKDYNRIYGGWLFSYNLIKK